ncbi:hypothetical protein M569_10128, partial [Genlisea aurea]
SPTPISRSDDRSQNPYPTTFIQADTSNFKQVVQMLTGSSDRKTGGGNMPPIKSVAQKKPGFKLYERRNSLKNGLMINTGFSARKTEILSPSVLDFPSLALSPATPLNRDCLAAAECSPRTEEEKAIAEKKFYLHPSPRTNAADLQLLSLFP